ncbi:TPA: hypothetical protein ACU6IV_002251 [Pseudomonas aeruginosa]
MNGKHIAVQSTTKNMDFLIKKCPESLEFFRQAVITNHYLLDSSLMNVKTTLVLEGKEEDLEFFQIPTDKLKGLVVRVGMKKYVNEDVSDLLLFYFPLTNSFVFKEASGEISHSFDFFRYT